MLNLFPGRAPVSPPHFKDLYALTGEPKHEVDFLAKVGRWTTAFNEGTYRLAYPRRFDIGERHSSRLLTVKLRGRPGAPTKRCGRTMSFSARGA